MNATSTPHLDRQDPGSHLGPLVGRILCSRLFRKPPPPPPTLSSVLWLKHIIPSPTPPLCRALVLSVPLPGTVPLDLHTDDLCLSLSSRPWVTPSGWLPCTPPGAPCLSTLEFSSCCTSTAHLSPLLPGLENLRNWPSGKGTGSSWSDFPSGWPV